MRATFLLIMITFSSMLYVQLILHEYQSNLRQVDKVLSFVMFCKQMSILKPVCQLNFQFFGSSISLPFCLLIYQEFSSVIYPSRYKAAVTTNVRSNGWILSIRTKKLCSRIEKIRAINSSDAKQTLLLSRKKQLNERLHVKTTTQQRENTRINVYKNLYIFFCSLYIIIQCQVFLRCSIQQPFC